MEDGTIEITNSNIYAGKFAAAGIGINGDAFLSCLGSTSIYANNEATNVYCIAIGSSLNTVTINSSGAFRSRGNYAIYCNVNALNADIIITKGNFAACNSNSSSDTRIFYRNGPQGPRTSTYGSFGLFYMAPDKTVTSCTCIVNYWHSCNITSQTTI